MLLGRLYSTFFANPSKKTPPSLNEAYALAESKMMV
jgi:hypothetical protein